MIEKTFTFLRFRKNSFYQVLDAFFTGRVKKHLNKAWKE